MKSEEPMAWRTSVEQNQAIAAETAKGLASLTKGLENSHC
jgi:hypothetical protein